MSCDRYASFHCSPNLLVMSLTYPDIIYKHFCPLQTSEIQLSIPIISPPGQHLYDVASYSTYVYAQTVIMIKMSGATSQRKDITPVDWDWSYGDNYCSGYWDSKEYVCHWSKTKGALVKSQVLLVCWSSLQIEIFLKGNHVINTEDIVALEKWKALEWLNINGQWDCIMIPATWLTHHHWWHPPIHNSAKSSSQKCPA